MDDWLVLSHRAKSYRKASNRLNDRIYIDCDVDLLDLCFSRLYRLWATIVKFLTDKPIFWIWGLNPDSLLSSHAWPKNSHSKVNQEKNSTKTPSRGS